MAIKIIKANDAAESEKINALVYGGSGVGKTVLSASSDTPTLIISADRGLKSLKGAPDNVEVAIISSLDELDEMYDDIYTHEPDYDWISLDSLSEIGEVVLAEEKKKVKDGRKAYGEYRDIMMERIRKFRDLDYNVLMTAKLGRLSDDNTGFVSYGPDMPGNQLGPQLAYYFDLVMHLSVMEDDDGNEVRELQTVATKTHVCKNRGDELDDYEIANLKHIASKLSGGETPKPKRKKLKRKLKKGKK